jgi:hypothetical protein
LLCPSILEVVLTFLLLKMKCLVFLLPIIQNLWEFYVSGHSVGSPHGGEFNDPVLPFYVGGKIRVQLGKNLLN